MAREIWVLTRIDDGFISLSVCGSEESAETRRSELLEPERWQAVRYIPAEEEKK